MKLRVMCFTCLVLVLGIHSVARGQIYRAIDLYTLDLPGFHPTQFGIAGVNSWNSGAIAKGGQVVAHAGGHALMWNGVGGAPIDLGADAKAYATDGAQQVGENGHALLWSGSAESVVDLNPSNLSGFKTSGAYGVDDTQQVGYGVDSRGFSHALMWSGTAESTVDLNPTYVNIDSVYNTVALAVSDGRQVGYGAKLVNYGAYGYGVVADALLWNNTANSVVDLNPIRLGFGGDSYAVATSRNQQVGFYGTDGGGSHHAILWSGSADSAVDLNPTNLGGFYDSYALGTNGVQQVGYGDGSDFGWHALLWNGTADSAIDLEQLLPTDLQGSKAYSIDGDGNVFGLAYDSARNAHAIEWVPVPEPSSMLISALGVVSLAIFQARTNKCDSEFFIPRS
jgi:hypothetical protein